MSLQDSSLVRKYIDTPIGIGFSRVVRPVPALVLSVAFLVFILATGPDSQSAWNLISAILFVPTILFAVWSLVWLLESRRRR